MRATVALNLCFFMVVLRRLKALSLTNDHVKILFEEEPVLLVESERENETLRPNPDETGPHYEGDIIRPGGFERQVRAVTNADFKKWIKGVIPYTMDPYYSLAQKQIIYSAMDEIRKKTCINFVERTTEADYVRIMPGEGCSSYVGRRGGQQVVTLDPWRCLTEVGVVAHELLHVLGFYHEHTRLDRDDYINVLWNNMESGREVNFHKRTPGSIDDLGKQYDYNSVMHYSAYAFSLDERRPTIMPRQNSVTLKALGQRRELSSLDVDKVNAYYTCLAQSSSGGQRNEVKYLNYFKTPEEELVPPVPSVRRTTPTPTTTTKPPPPQYREPKPSVSFKSLSTASPNPCDDEFRPDAMLTTTDGHLYIFSSSYFWVIDPHRYISKALLIKDYYPTLPNEIDAAFTWINGHTYFFKDQSYWKYDGFSPLEGYPQETKSGFPGLPDLIDAAFLWSEGRIVFIKDDAYWVLHPTYFNQVRGPLPLRPGLGFPTNIQAGLEWPSISTTSSSADVWLVADGLMYPLDGNVFKISNEKHQRRLSEWLRCDLYERSSTLSGDGSSY